jgi:hypothetical protein
MALLGCSRSEGRTATCPGALVIAEHFVDSGPYLERKRAAIEIVEADAQGNYVVHPPATVVGRTQTISTEYAGASCAVGPRGYRERNVQARRIAEVVEALEPECASGAIDAAGCALAKAHAAAHAAELRAAYPDLVSGKPAGARTLAFGRAIVPLWSTLRGVPSEPIQGVELGDGTAAIVDRLTDASGSGDAGASSRAGLALVSQEGALLAKVDLEGARDAVVAALPSPELVPGAALVVVTPEALLFLDGRGEKRSRVPIAEPLRPKPLPNAPERSRDDARTALRDALVVVREGDVSLLVVAEGVVVRLGLDGVRLQARELSALEVAGAVGDRLWFVRRAENSAPSAGLLPGTTGFKLGSTPVELASVPLDLTSTEAPIPTVAGVSAIAAHADGFDALLVGDDLTTTMRSTAFFERLDVAGKHQAGFEIADPELGRWARRFLRPWSGSKRRLAIAGDGAVRRGGYDRYGTEYLDAGVDLLELRAP